MTNERAMKQKTKILLIFLVALLCVVGPGFYNRLKVVRYIIGGAFGSGNIRIALVTDLHSCDYGEDQRELVDAIEAEAPDLLLLGGDIFDDDLPDDATVSFLRGVQGKYPCYYVTGNHEYWSGQNGFEKKMALLKEYGVVRLSGDMAVLSIKGIQVNLCGVDDPYAWADNGYPM